MACAGSRSAGKERAGLLLGRDGWRRRGVWIIGWMRCRGRNICSSGRSIARGRGRFVFEGKGAWLRCSGALYGYWGSVKASAVCPGGSDIEDGYMII